MVSVIVSWLVSAVFDKIPFFVSLCLVRFISIYYIYRWRWRALQMKD